ncbi:MAG: adenylate/guanylate cyclase domain-containing protein [Alphaproteobacteria bacterium]|nr:adenylate/guanylate cyclase domain-containing protein [Alphaproteobacteria bacterium]
MKRLKAARTDVLDPKIAEYGGRIVKTTGDGTLCEFSSAVDAVQCAGDIQIAIAELGAGNPEEIRLQFRIGINLGDILLDGDDILGDGVNVAARIEALAAPGGISVSGSIFDQVDGKLDLVFEDKGKQRVKNISRPIQVHAVRMEAGPGERAKPVAPAIVGSRPVIAVLPFENMSSAAEDEYFADGLTEDIITALSRFRELLVIARNSTFQYKGRAVDVPQVGRELNVGYVVEGSVRRAANRVRITAQLIQTSDGTHLWAERYDREMEDIFAVQDEVTQTIAAALGVRMQDAARERALRKNPADLNAYDCVLRARRYTVTMSLDEHAAARDLLEKAIALDPNYAEAYAMLANVYLAEYRFNSNPRPNPIERALAMVQKAIEFDPQNAYSRCWLAIIHFFLHENENFEAEAQRALALNPNDPETLAELGHYYAFMGKYERGAELTRRAIALNPLHPGWYHFCFARKHFAEHDYTAAIADVRKINLPDFYWSWLIETAALGHMGETQRAADALAKIRALMPDFSPRAELHKWNAAPDDFEHIMDGLKKAGFKEAD